MITFSTIKIGFEFGALVVTSQREQAVRNMLRADRTSSHRVANLTTKHLVIFITLQQPISNE